MVGALKILKEKGRRKCIYFCLEGHCRVFWVRPCGRGTLCWLLSVTCEVQLALEILLKIKTEAKHECFSYMAVGWSYLAYHHGSSVVDFLHLAAAAIKANGNIPLGLEKQRPARTCLNPERALTYFFPPHIQTCF